MINTVFGKSMEDVRNNSEIRVIKANTRRSSVRSKLLDSKVFFRNSSTNTNEKQNKTNNSKNEYSSLFRFINIRN